MFVWVVSAGRSRGTSQESSLLSSLVSPQHSTTLSVFTTFEIRRSGDAVGRTAAWLAFVATRPCSCSSSLPSLGYFEIAPRYLAPTYGRAFLGACTTHASTHPSCWHVCPESNIQVCAGDEAQTYLSSIRTQCLQRRRARELCDAAQSMHRSLLPQSLRSGTTGSLCHQ